MCREQVAELRPHIPSLRAAGGDLVIVGCGGPYFLEAFKEDMQIQDVTVWSDEARAA